MGGLDLKIFFKHKKHILKENSVVILFDLFKEIILIAYIRHAYFSSPGNTNQFLPPILCGTDDTDTVERASAPPASHLHQIVYEMSKPSNITPI